MCKAEGMGIAPWGALGSGNFKTKAQREEMEKAGDTGRNMPGFGNPADAAVTDVLEKLAKAKGHSITGIALAYVMQKTPYVFRK
jgi:aryl-alcohol dehydrogenase-like predicted oxidoreductase